MDWIESIEARNRKQAKYDKENTVGIYMKLTLMKISSWDFDRQLTVSISRQGYSITSAKRQKETVIINISSSLMRSIAET